MAGWVTAYLGSVADMATDKISVSKLTTESYISTENMLPDRGGVELSAKLPPSGSVNAFLPGDVLFSNIRTYFKKVWLAPRRGGASADVIVFRPKEGGKIESQYLYYILSSDAFIESTVTASKGTKMPRGDKEAMRRFEFVLPPPPIQRRIAGILSAYDELIENSQRRIKILEAMARALYREWFVHFRFPGHESVPRVPSPLGEIPQGWQVRRIGDVFQTVLGGTPSRARPDFWKDGTVPWINSGKVNDLRITEASELITELALQKSAAKLMPKGTTVLAITGATLGQVSYLEIETAANQSVVGIVDASETRSEWLYLTVCERIEGIIKHASGGAQQHINKEIVIDVQVAIPPDSLAKDFRQLVSPMFRDIAKLLFQVQNLRRTRDLLIPRLLSGQIDVEAIAP